MKPHLKTSSVLAIRRLRIYNVGQ